MKIRKAVILAAGFGTRLLPITKAIPKEMINIFNKPAIQYIVEECILSGIKDILIVTSRNKELIENFFDSSPELAENIRSKSGKDELLKIQSLYKKADIYFIRQIEPKGTGHAVMRAKSFIGDEAFALLLPDDIIKSKIPAIKQLIEVYEATNCSVVAVEEVSIEQAGNYGVAVVRNLHQKINNIIKIEEKPNNPKSNLAIVGRYILKPKIFNLLEKTTYGVNNEIHITDAISSLLNYDEIKALKIYGKRFDIGSKKGYVNAFFEYLIHFAYENIEYQEIILNIKNIVNSNRNYQANNCD
ncbi:UTP--glucose-1-phosphate uridylyltransferase [Clostridiaceae bacterium M8S5]|nr:UTP--glucose-1-phosphate uridylyltransferase [Clostridiaceae bacterium M8S5]